ncbi:sugar phosphate isomerase/epimerase family protein [Paenibacillus nasutitermitis]|uniref:Hexulose-6-phosphate isomerase n=1 Tax=Paenibacillus nasutitermitis TaxID=1652958 RepID=A0A916ZIN6_9BACL|nr:sugar phosphate isomerase/epimerase family protein [Paenibacillus nasutitermitis]GGD98497.1 hexulose-6-phosphate isomerase [Paenibacillus nasutitermitis]
MLKSVNQWCFAADTPLERVLEVSKDAGYDAVELNLYEPGGIGLTMDTTAAQAEEVGRLARSHGLQLRSLSTGLLWGHPLSSPDAQVREQGRRIVVKQLELAELLGIDTVLVVPGAVNKDTSYDQCYERSQREMLILAQEAEKRKVRIGVENVWNKFLLSPLEMARYVDECQSDYVGVYFDVGNILLYGFPEQWIRILGSRIFKIHVKDFKTDVGNGSGFVSLLSGDVDWSAVRSALGEIGYTDTLTAELGIYKSDPLQLIYDTARHLEIILGGNAR